VKATGAANETSATPAPADMFAFVYDELRRLARRQRRAQNEEPTLDTTALVHEAYLKLHQSAHLKGLERSHFFALAARAMRQILVDQARRRGVRRRSGQIALTTGSDEFVADGDGELVDVVALDGALTRLTELDPRGGQVVEWRVFGGMDMVEIAQLQGLTQRTIARDWRRACAFLVQQLGLTPINPATEL
jgi:RNA polymerase sigma factor (TIGR02999 family)